MKGCIFVVSAPSGSGKSTLCERLISRLPNLIRSISHTTRPPRGNEVNGKDYFFVSEEDFGSMIEKGAFAEWAEIYSFRYGTSKEFLLEQIEKGVDVVLSIDVQGVMKLESTPFQPVRIFLLPPSIDELLRRLIGRGTETEKAIDLRIERAKEEMRQWNEYDYVIVNDHLEKALKEMESIVIAERKSTDRVAEEVLRILERSGIK
jgi:guanylate kinase